MRCVGCRLTKDERGRGDTRNDLRDRCCSSIIGMMRRGRHGLINDDRGGSTGRRLPSRSVRRDDAELIDQDIEEPLAGCRCECMLCVGQPHDRAERCCLVSTGIEGGVIRGVVDGAMEEVVGGSPLEGESKNFRAISFEYEPDLTAPGIGLMTIGVDPDVGHIIGASSVEPVAI
ncbi:hypothetical protein C8Q76DRAFT_316055 [Earliella scabrosa]|nr:hypothetical protein C8Q76DRAFT_316055 [Earliella scabrosa]